MTPALAPDLDLPRTPPDSIGSCPQENQTSEWPGRGEHLARSIEPSSQRIAVRKWRPEGRLRLKAFIVKTAAGYPWHENSVWVLENSRLLRSAERSARDFIREASRLPAVSENGGKKIPRACAIVRQYLDQSVNGFNEEDLIAFVEGYQQIAMLDMAEISALRPALELEILDRLTNSAPDDWPVLITSMHRVSDANWKGAFKALSRVDQMLADDPAGAWTRMDFESCEYYRQVIEDLARHSPHNEREIAALALSLARQALSIPDRSRAALRRSHVGFYLTDLGLAQLESVAGYQPTFSGRISRLLLRQPTAFYLLSIELLTLFIVFGMLSGLDSLTPVFAGLALLLLPATQAAVDFVNNLTTSLIRPRRLPKLDFSGGIPDTCVTMVAVPSLLLNEAQVRDLVLDLEIRFLANRDPNLYFALLTDSPDSDHATDQDAALVDLCIQLVEGLNERYRAEDRMPFFMLHRHHIYNESEGRWMGWERKRGKLMDLNRLLRGSPDAFPTKAGDPSIFSKVRYVITLDSDTQLPRDCAARLIGAIAHPLNQAVVDPGTRMVVEGYGILQPRIGISIQSASRSRLAALYSGQTGFDIYTRAISDVYQDLFREGIFTGKGIYEVDVLRETLEKRFPENALLSHDLIEGAYARAALVSDTELIDDYPTHFSSYSRRKHRWVRGDWQILRWVLPRVPDSCRQMIPNPISLISQWKILDNLRRSMFEPSLLLLLLGSWFYLPESPAHLTIAAVAVLFISPYSHFLFGLLHAPKRARTVPAWLWEMTKRFLEGNAAALVSVIFLLHQSLLSIDAIIRSLTRVFVTRRKLLEWETAAEAEATVRPKATVDIYLEWTPWITLALGLAIWWIRPAALLPAAPILLLWLVSRPASSWLNRPPHTGKCKLAEQDVWLLRDSAERIYRFFRDWSSASTNWLIPDNVRENGAADMRLSPTNLAMLLNVRIAAVHLGLASLAEFVFETRQTLDRVLALPKYRGHLLNWYDVQSLKPLDPQFVSTVDSGNLAASLWTLKHAALAFAAEPPARRGLNVALAEQLAQIAEISHRLVENMDFRFLYDERKTALSVGCNASTGQKEASCYDLLASEARIATFVAIAKGDLPQQAWLHLGRLHTLYHGERIMLSWTGTMFEYLMPALWMRHYSGTITELSVRATVRAQREYARRKHIPWGISEAACLGNKEGDYGYAPFGIPALALKETSGALVISPYSSFLALAVDPQGAIRNLRDIEEYGWTGRYGFYESIEYTPAGGQPIRSWMAHHQGMSLLSITNLLFDKLLQQYFHSEPQVLATELLLHERLPATTLPEPSVALPGLAPAEA